LDRDPISINILFDECIGQRVAESLVNVLQLDTRFSLNAEYLKRWIAEGASDQEWVPRARDERRFVITADSGRQRKGPPLQLLLPYHGVSGAFFTGGVHNKPQVEKARAILSLWSHIVDAAIEDTVGRYRMGIHTKAKNGLVSTFAWKEWPLSKKEQERLRDEQGSFRETFDFK